MDDIPRKLIIPIKTAGFLFLHHKINNKNRKRLDFEPPEVIAALTFLESHSPGKQLQVSHVTSVVSDQPVMVSLSPPGKQREDFWHVVPPSALCPDKGTRGRWCWQGTWDQPLIGGG